MDREAWRAVIHGVAKSWTPLSDWTELKADICKFKNTWALEIAIKSEEAEIKMPGADSACSYLQFVQQFTYVYEGKVLHF